jgi:hypothetical protein
MSGEDHAGVADQLMPPTQRSPLVQALHATRPVLSDCTGVNRV